MASEAAAAASQAERALVEGRPADVAAALDAVELQSADPAVLAPPWPAAAHLLAHILNDDLEDARFLWKRLPAEARAARPARAAFSLLQAAWARDLEGVAASAAALEPAVAGEGAAAAGLVPPLRAALRRRAAAVVARAYTRLTAARLAALLGCGTAEEAGALARGYGWSVGGDGVVSGLVAPGGGGGGGGGEVVAAGPTADLLDAFVDYVVELEA